MPAIFSGTPGNTPARPKSWPKVGGKKSGDLGPDREIQLMLVQPSTDVRRTFREAIRTRDGEAIRKQQTCWVGIMGTVAQSILSSLFETIAMMRLASLKAGWISQPAAILVATGEPEPWTAEKRILRIKNHSSCFPKGTAQSSDFRSNSPSRDVLKPVKLSGSGTKKQ